MKNAPPFKDAVLQHCGIVMILGTEVSFDAMVLVI